MHRGSLPIRRRYPLPPPGGSHLLLMGRLPEKRRHGVGYYQDIAAVDPEQLAGACRLYPE